MSARFAKTAEAPKKCRAMAAEGVGNIELRDADGEPIAPSILLGRVASSGPGLERAMRLPRQFAYLRTDSTGAGWIWEIRQFGRDRPIEVSGQVFRSEAAARAAGLMRLDQIGSVVLPPAAKN